MAHTVHFTAWITPDTTERPPAASHISKRLWLPLIGPTAWLIWGTLAHDLTHTATTEHTVDRLAHAHGIGANPAPNGPVHRTLRRLTNYGLIAPHHDTYLVHLTAPPLRPRQLERLPRHLVQLHETTYPTRLRPTG